MGRFLLLPIRILPARAIFLVSWAVGTLIYTIHLRRRRIALDNLNRAFGSELPPRRIRELARRNFAHVVRVSLETARLPGLRGQIDRVVHLENEGYLAQALGQGKGVLLLVSHLGNFIYGAARVAADFPMAMVVRPPSNRLVRSLTEEIAQRMNIEMIPRRRGMRGILRALSKGKALLIALDQHASKDSVVVDFFARPAATPNVVALLMLKHSIPVVPAFTWRARDGFQVVFFPPVPITRTEDLGRGIRENTQRFTSLIEEQIRLHPDQWLWMHRRWRLD